MDPKELFFSKIASHTPQVMEMASEVGLHNMTPSPAQGLIGKWVEKDAEEVGHFLEPADDRVSTDRLARIRPAGALHQLLGNGVQADGLGPGLLAGIAHAIPAS